MKPRSTQFDVRENTASPRQHAPRFESDTHSTSICAEQENPVRGFDDPLHAAPNHAATGGREEERGPLLTVHEVAQLLHVPASWVYERTRRRNSDQLPHVKLGKYLRFEEAAITEFIQRQRCA